MYIRFLCVPIVVGKVRSFLNTVENALVKGVFVLGKISKSKFLLELAQAVFSELLEKVMLDQEGMLVNITFHIFRFHQVICYTILRNFSFSNYCYFWPYSPWVTIIVVLK